MMQSQAPPRPNKAKRYPKRDTAQIAQLREEKKAEAQKQKLLKSKGMAKDKVNVIRKSDSTNSLSKQPMSDGHHHDFLFGSPPMFQNLNKDLPFASSQQPAMKPKENMKGVALENPTSDGVHHDFLFGSPPMFQNLNKDLPFAASGDNLTASSQSEVIYGISPPSGCVQIVDGAGRYLKTDSNGVLTFEDIEKDDPMSPKYMWNLIHSENGGYALCSTYGKFFTHCMVWGLVANRDSAHSWEELTIRANDPKGETYFIRTWRNQYLGVTSTGGLKACASNDGVDTHFQFIKI